MKNYSKRKLLKKTVLAAAFVSAVGVSATASATIVDFSWSGLFTMLDPSGTALQNTSYPYYGDPTWSYGYRTQITGTMSFDTVTGAGSGTIVPFQFFGGNASLPNSFLNHLTLQAIGNGAGDPGTLILGNMLWNWGSSNGIPISIVWDGAGLFNSMFTPGFGPGSVISGTGAIPASNAIRKGSIPIGPAPVATTGWNTTTVPGASMGSAVSGQLPLIADTIGGSPMIAGPFTGYNINLDITSITFAPVCEYGICPPPIPVPAAVWLFGSGLLGLLGFMRRAKS